MSPFKESTKGELNISLNTFPKTNFLYYYLLVLFWTWQGDFTVESLTVENSHSCAEVNPYECLVSVAWNLMHFQTECPIV